MKRFVKRNIKYILTALLLLVFLCCAIRGIHIRSVQDVRQEAQELAGITGNNNPESQGESGQNIDSDIGIGSDNLETELSNSETEKSEEAQTGDSEKKTQTNPNDSDGSNAVRNKKNNSSEQQTVTGKQGSAGKKEKTSDGKQGSAEKTFGGKQGSAQKTGKSGKKQTKASDSVSNKRKISDGSSTKPDQYHTDPVPSGRPEPVNAEEQTVNQKRSFYVYLSIDVKTILDHMEDLKPGLQKYVPEDGWILPKTQVLCYEGETAWDVMSRECKARGINVETSYTPLYNSVYMEGINHIGEFDCGATAGWVYEVNGWIPNYSSSRYVMVEGEYLRWRYSCTGSGSDLEEL